MCVDAGADYEKGAWVAQMPDQYNRQAHPEEVRLIKEQAQALATEQNISVAEAERRMAQAFAYYTDKKWQELLTKDGLVIDSSTMTHHRARQRPEHQCRARLPQCGRCAAKRP